MASTGSRRPLVSSARIRSATWMPNPVPISAIVSIVTAKYWSTMSPEPMPRSFSMSVLSPSRASASRPVSPSETPLKNRPMLQPMITPRWRRTASPSGWRSTGLAPGGPGRWGRIPAPSSRRARSAIAPATSTALDATISASGHHCSPAYGRMYWPQPIGDSHDSVPSPTSPAARSR